MTGPIDGPLDSVFHTDTQYNQGGGTQPGPSTGGVGQDPEFFMPADTSGLDDGRRSPDRSSKGSAKQSGSVSNQASALQEHRANPDNLAPNTFVRESLPRAVQHNNDHLAVVDNSKYFHAAVNNSDLISNHNKSTFRVDSNNRQLTLDANGGNAAINTNNDQIDSDHNNSHIEIGTNAGKFNSVNSTKLSRENVTANAKDMTIRNSRSYHTIGSQTGNVVLGRPARSGTDARDAQPEKVIRPPKTHGPTPELRLGEGPDSIVLVERQDAQPEMPGHILPASPAVAATPGNPSQAGLVGPGKMHIADQNGYVTQHFEEGSEMHKKYPEGRTYGPTPGKSLTLDENGPVQEESNFKTYVRRPAAWVGNNAIRVNNLLAPAGTVAGVAAYLYPHNATGSQSGGATTTSIVPGATTTPAGGGLGAMHAHQTGAIMPDVPQLQTHSEPTPLAFDAAGVPQVGSHEPGDTPAYVVVPGATSGDSGSETMATPPSGFRTMTRGQRGE